MKKIGLNPLFTLVLLLPCFSIANTLEIKVRSKYLNFPVGHEASRVLIRVEQDGKEVKEFAIQLAEGQVDYWSYINVEEFIGSTIVLKCKVSNERLAGIYQSDRFAGQDSLYRESNRPQFHFTTKKGWLNDINGPMYYKGKYHLFFQNYPYGIDWHTGYMRWGHAVSDDLLHWEELEPALDVDSLGSPWSGTAVVDTDNRGGLGKGTVYLFYTSYNLISGEQVQCMAYSTDGAKTFTKYDGNPVLDNHVELGTMNIRDPKVFWHEPSQKWVMILTEDASMGFYNSSDLIHWERKSNFPGLFECPDMFQIAVEGAPDNKKWVLHGGSTDYYIGRFDGEEFVPESPKLSFGKGKIYAGQSMVNMPNGRVVHFSWGREITHPGMDFAQVVLFPVEFKLKRVEDSLRLFASPIAEIAQLHRDSHEWKSLSTAEANGHLAQVESGPSRLMADFRLREGQRLELRYQGNVLVDLDYGELGGKPVHIDVLVDKTLAEVFVNQGEKYLAMPLDKSLNRKGFEFAEQSGLTLDQLEVHGIRSIWE